MLVSVFKTNKYSYSESGTGSPTIIRLGLWKARCITQWELVTTDVTIMLLHLTKHFY
jgi:hypothetical protein